MKSRTPLAAAAITGMLVAPAVTVALAAQHDGTPPDHRALQPELAGHTVFGQLHQAGHHALVRRDIRLADAVERLGGDAPSHHALSLMSTRSLRHQRKALKAERKRLKRARSSYAAAGPVSGTLQAIAACESGGDPTAIGGGGAFRGKYQFTYATWAAVGGSGDPAAAPEAEQDARAATLYATAGAGQWPVCGR